MSVDERKRVAAATEVTRGAPIQELYDVLADPHETHNLAGDSAHSQVQQQLASALADWMHQSNDPILAGPIPDPRK